MTFCVFQDFWTEHIDSQGLLDFNDVQQFIQEKEVNFCKTVQFFNRIATANRL